MVVAAACQVACVSEAPRVSGVSVKWWSVVERLLGTEGLALFGSGRRQG